MNPLNVIVTNSVIDSGIKPALNNPIKLPTGITKITTWNVPWTKGGNPELLPNQTPPVVGTPAIPGVPAVPPSGPIYGGGYWQQSEAGNGTPEGTVWWDGVPVDGMHPQDLKAFFSGNVRRYEVYNPVFAENLSARFVRAAQSNPTGFNKFDGESQTPHGVGLPKGWRPSHYASTIPSNPAVGDTIVFYGTEYEYSVYDWKAGSRTEAENIGSRLIISLRYWRWSEQIVGYENPGSPAIPPVPSTVIPPTPATAAGIKDALHGANAASVLASGILAAIERLASRMNEPGWENIKTRLTYMFGPTGKPDMHPADFLSSAQTYYDQVFGNPFPVGTQIPATLIPDSALTGPKTRSVIPAFMCLPMVTSINDMLTTLGRPADGDRVSDLIESGGEISELFASEEDRNKIFAISCFNGFGVYANLGWSELLAIYRPYLDDYYVKAVGGVVTAGANHPYKAQSVEEGTRNASRALDLLESVYGNLYSSTVRLANLPNAMMELSISNSISGTAESLLSGVDIMGVAKSAEKLAADAKTAAGLFSKSVLDKVVEVKAMNIR